MENLRDEVKSKALYQEEMEAHPRFSPEEDWLGYLPMAVNGVPQLEDMGEGNYKVLKTPCWDEEQRITVRSRAGIDLPAIIKANQNDRIQYHYVGWPEDSDAWIMKNDDRIVLKSEREEIPLHSAKFLASGELDSSALGIEDQEGKATKLKIAAGAVVRGISTGDGWVHVMKVNCADIQDMQTCNSYVNICHWVNGVRDLDEYNYVTGELRGSVELNSIRRSACQVGRDPLPEWKSYWLPMTWKGRNLLTKKETGPVSTYELTKPDEVMQKGIDKRITANMDNKVNNKRALADCLSGKKWDPKKKNNKNAEQREAEEEELQTKEAKVDKIDTWLGVSDSDMESCLKEHMRENAGGWVPWGATVKGHELTVEGKRWLHVVPGGPLFHHLVEGDAWGKHVFLGFDVKGSGAIEGKGYAPGWGRFDIYGTNPGHLAPTHGEAGPVQENGKATGVFHMKIEFWPSGSNKDSQKSVLGLRLGWKGDALTGQGYYESDTVLLLGLLLRAQMYNQPREALHLLGIASKPLLRDEQRDIQRLFCWIRR